MNDQFDDWLRETIPEVKEDETKKDIHLAILKERIRAREIRRRNRRNRSFLIALPVLLLTGFAWNVVELGGDGFDIERIEVETIPGEIAKTGHREDGVHVLVNDSDEELQEFFQQSAAGEGVVLDMEGWVVKGNAHWLIRKSFDLMGKTTTVAQSPVDPPSKLTRELMEFLTNERKAIETEILLGNIQPSTTVEVELDGTLFLADWWTIETEKYGTISCYRGKPIR